MFAERTLSLKRLSPVSFVSNMKLWELVTATIERQMFFTQFYVDDRCFYSVLCRWKKKCHPSLNYTLRVAILIFQEP